jgi:hypothetical protein
MKRSPHPELKPDFSVNIMQYISSYLNLWEQMLALKLVNKKWYLLVNKFDSKLDHKQRWGILEPLVKDEKNFGLIAGFVYQQIASQKPKIVSSHTRSTYLTLGVLAGIPTAFLGALAYFSFAIHTGKQFARDLYNNQFIDTCEPEWCDKNIAVVACKTYFKICMKEDLSTYNQKDFCEYLLFQAQQTLCSPAFRGDIAGVVLFTVLSLIACVIACVIVPNICKGDSCIPLATFRDLRLNKKIINLLYLVLKVRTINGDDPLSDVLEKLEGLYQEIEDTTPIEICVIGDEKETAKTRIEDLKEPLLPKPSKSGFSDFFSMPKTVSRDSSWSSKCMCIIL